MKLLVLLFLLPALALAHYPGIRVIDGDTVYVPTHMVSGFPVGISVRVLGVDTPETRGAKCDNERQMGEAAKIFVRDVLAKAESVSITYRKWDKYGGRINGTIVVDGKDLGTMLIAAGLAVPYSGGARANVWCP